MEDAGVGFFFLRLDEDAFDVAVCGSVVDDERNLGFLCGENVVSEGGFLQGCGRVCGAKEIESAFSEGDDAFGVRFLPLEQLFWGWGWVCFGEVCGVRSCGAEDKRLF